MFAIFYFMAMTIVMVLAVIDVSFPPNGDVRAQCIIGGAAGFMALISFIIVFDAMNKFL